LHIQTTGIKWLFLSDAKETDLELAAVLQQSCNFSRSDNGNKSSSNAVIEVDTWILDSGCATKVHNEKIFPFPWADPDSHLIQSSCLL